MFTFSPDPDDGPFVAWSWQRSGEHSELVNAGSQGQYWRTIEGCEELPYTDVMLRDSVSRLVQAGFRAIDLPIDGTTDSETFYATLRLIGFCHAAGLNVWLRPEMPWSVCKGHLGFEVHDLGTAEAATWVLPRVYLKTFIAEAVPLDANYGAPRWSALRSLDIHDHSQHQQILASLAAAGAGVRVWVWRKGMQNESCQLPGRWTRTAEYLLSATAKAGTAGIVRGVHLNQFDPGTQPGRNFFPYIAEMEGHFEALEGNPFPTSFAWLIGPTDDDAVRMRRHYWEALALAFNEVYWRPAEVFCADQALTLRGSLLMGKRSKGLLLMPGEEGSVTFVDRRLALLAVRRAASHAGLAGKKSPLISPFDKGFFDTHLNPDWIETPASSTQMYSRLLADGTSAVETSVAVAFHLDLPNILQQPFTPHLATFNDTLADMTAALAGAPAARVGLLWPDRSLQSHYNPKGHRNVRWVEEDLNATVALLDELHFDFVFCDEAHLEQATIEVGHGECSLLCGAGNHPLSLIVLPSVTALSWATWNKLEEFIAAGGKLICLGLLPRWSEKGRDPEFEAHVGKSTMLIVADLYSAYGTAGSDNAIPDQSHGDEEDEDEEVVSVIGYPVVRSRPSGGRVGCYQPRLNDDRDDARLRVNQLLTESIAPDMETQAENVRLTRRHAEGGDIVMVTNLSGHAQRVNLRVRTRVPASPYRCDPHSGQVTPIYEWMELSGFDGQGAALTLEMGGGEVALVHFAECAPLPHAERSNFVIESFENGIIRGHATAGGVAHASVLNPADERVAQYAGPEVAIPAPIVLQGEWQAELGGLNMLALDLTRDESGASWAGTFAVGEAIGPLYLRLPTFAGEVTLDGLALDQLALPLPEALLAGACNSMSGDTRWFVLHCEAGEHELRVADLYDWSKYFGHKQYKALVVGDFMLDDDGAVVAARPLHLEEGSWHEQGLRDYSGEVVYNKTVPIPASFAGCRVFFELHVMRDTVEALVDGVSLGVRSVPPYRFDATAAIRPGEQCAVALRIFNTSAAAERRNKNNYIEEEWGERPTPPAGLLGPVRLVAYPLVEIEVPNP